MRIHPDEGRTLNESIPHKLIIFYGAGSGIGKSTLSSFTQRQLKLNEIDSRLVREEDVLRLDSFSPYVSRVKRGDGGNSEVLLSACSTFIEECGTSESVYVMDSILPCWDWLFTAGCPREEIDEFSHKLDALLQRLHSLMIFLSGDLNISVDRAIADRGEDWAKSLALKRSKDSNTESLLPTSPRCKK